MTSDPQIASYSNDDPVRKYLQLMARYERLMEISRQLHNPADCRPGSR